MDIKQPFIITISRELGSGGHTVGRKLAEDGRHLQKRGNRTANLCRKEDYANLKDKKHHFFDARQPEIWVRFDTFSSIGKQR